MNPKNFALLIFGAVVLIVLLQNTQVVTLRFLFWELSMSRIILIPIIILIGFLAGYLTGKR